MAFGKTRAKQREVARKHTAHVLHICPQCHRAIRGNAYYLHLKTCRAAFTTTDLAVTLGPELQVSRFQVDIIDDSVAKAFKLVSVKYDGKVLIDINKTVRMLPVDAFAFKAKLEAPFMPT